MPDLVCRIKVVYALLIKLDNFFSSEIMILVRTLSTDIGSDSHINIPFQQWQALSSAWLIFYSWSTMKMRMHGWVVFFSFFLSATENVSHSGKKINLFFIFYSSIKIIYGIYEVKKALQFSTMDWHGTNQLRLRGDMLSSYLNRIVSRCCVERE